MISKAEKELRTKFIEKELLKHLKLLDEEPLSSDVLRAIDNVTKMVIANKLLKNSEIPEDQEAKTLKYLEMYIKQINRAE